MLLTSSYTATSSSGVPIVRPNLHHLTYYITNYTNATTVRVMVYRVVSLDSNRMAAVPFSQKKNTTN